MKIAHSRFQEGEMATLAFAKHVNKALKGSGQTSPRPLFILHGLFGSKRNWMTLSNKLADRLQTTVYAVDLPNHGESPWTQVAVSYSTMSADVSRLIQHVLEESGVSQFDLIGHSMVCLFQFELWPSIHFNHLISLGSKGRYDIGIIFIS